MHSYILTSSAFFAVIGLLHLLRALFGWKALIHTYVLPRGLSFFAAGVAFLLAFWGFSVLP